MIAIIKTDKMDPQYIEVEQTTIEDIYKKMKQDAPELSDLGIKSIEIFKDVDGVEQELTESLLAIATLAELTEGNITQGASGKDTYYRGRQAFFGLQNLMERVDILTYILGEEMEYHETDSELVSLIKKI